MVYFDKKIQNIKVHFSQRFQSVFVISESNILTSLHEFHTDPTCSNSANNDPNNSNCTENISTNTRHNQFKHRINLSTDFSSNTKASKIIIIFSFSFHHILGGLSLGVQKNFEFIWRLPIAILIHEIVMSFNFGLQFYKHKDISKKLYLAICLFYSLVFPCGNLIGILISKVTKI